MTTKTMTEASDEIVVQLSLRVPTKLRARVKVHCVRHEVTITTFVVEAIREGLRRTGCHRSE